MKLRVYLASLCVVTCTVILFTHFSYSGDDTHSTNTHNSADIHSMYSLPPTHYHNIAGLHGPSRLVAQDWTSIYGTQEDNSYHFFSAYFDGRPSSDLQRPAVIVMGYVYKDVDVVDIYCKFTYSDGLKVCRSAATPHRHVASCFAPQLGAKPYHYLCEVKEGESVPVGVQMSTSSKCDPNLTSALIPVKNRNVSAQGKPRKRFGICIAGPLVKESPRLLNDVIEYAEMIQVLGVDQVAFYVNETQVDTAMLEYIWKHYPDTVHTIGWKKFEKWYPLHYYGQLLIISDCLYRYMYEVERIAVIDLDEMILPVKHLTWAEMIAELGDNEDVSSYTFQNNFFTVPDDQKVETISDCDNRVVPKYFTSTDSHECYPGHQYRPKVMYIARYIYEANIHWPCSKVSGHGGGINVPPDLGLLGHFRYEVPDDCKDKPIHTDEMASRFKSQVIKSMCSKQSP